MWLENVWWWCALRKWLLTTSRNSKLVERCGNLRRGECQTWKGRTLRKKQRYPIIYLQLASRFKGNLWMNAPFPYPAVDLMFHLSLNIVKLFRLSSLNCTCTLYIHAELPTFQDVQLPNWHHRIPKHPKPFDFFAPTWSPWSIVVWSLKLA